MVNDVLKVLASEEDYRREKTKNRSGEMDSWNGLLCSGDIMQTPDLK